MKRKPIDDYDLMDRDFDEFMRKGIEAFADDHPGSWFSYQSTRDRRNEKEGRHG